MGGCLLFAVTLAICRPYPLTGSYNEIKTTLELYPTANSSMYADPVIGCYPTIFGDLILVISTT